MPPLATLVFFFFFGRVYYIICYNVSFCTAGSFESAGKSTHDQVLSSEIQVIGEIVENLVDNAKDDVQMPKPAAERETPDLHNEDYKVGAPEKNERVNNSNGQTGSPSPKEGTTKGFNSPRFMFFLLAVNRSQMFS